MWGDWHAGRHPRSPRAYLSRGLGLGVLAARALAKVNALHAQLEAFAVVLAAARSLTGTPLAVALAFIVRLGKFLVEGQRVTLQNFFASALAEGLVLSKIFAALTAALRRADRSTRETLAVKLEALGSRAEATLRRLRILVLGFLPRGDLPRQRPNHSFVKGGETLVF